MPDNRYTNPDGAHGDRLYDAAVAAAAAVCQRTYCAAEHCDLGGGTCAVCRAARLGIPVCGGCGIRYPTGDAPRVCPGTV
jgi:hypothetical protein